MSTLYRKPSAGAIIRTAGGGMAGDAACCCEIGHIDSICGMCLANAPDTLEAVISGIAPASGGTSCANCTQYNGTFILDYHSTVVTPGVGTICYYLYDRGSAIDCSYPNPANHQRYLVAYLTNNNTMTTPTGTYHVGVEWSINTPSGSVGGGPYFRNGYNSLQDCDFSSLSLSPQTYTVYCQGPATCLLSAI